MGSFSKFPRLGSFCSLLPLEQQLSSNHTSWERVKYAFSFLSVLFLSPVCLRRTPQSTILPYFLLGRPTTVVHVVVSSLHSPYFSSSPGLLLIGVVGRGFREPPKGFFMVLITALKMGGIQAKVSERSKRNKKTKLKCVSILWSVPHFNVSSFSNERIR